MPIMKLSLGDENKKLRWPNKDEAEELKDSCEELIKRNSYADFWLDGQGAIIDGYVRIGRQKPLPKGTKRNIQAQRGNRSIALVLLISANIDGFTCQQKKEQEEVERAVGEGLLLSAQQQRAVTVSGKLP